MAELWCWSNGWGIKRLEAKFRENRFRFRFRISASPSSTRLFFCQMKLHPLFHVLTTSFSTYTMSDGAFERNTVGCGDWGNWTAAVPPCLVSLIFCEVPRVISDWPSCLWRALSRSNKKLLHVDQNEYYGGSEAAFSLQEVDEWVEQSKEGQWIRDPKLSFFEAYTFQTVVDLSEI